MSYDGVPKYSTVAEDGMDPPSSVSDRTRDAMEGWFNIVPHPANTPRSVVGGFLKAMLRRRGLPCPGVEEAVAAKLILVRRWLRLIEALLLLVKIHKIVASEIWCNVRYLSSQTYGREAIIFFKSNIQERGRD